MTNEQITQVVNDLAKEGTSQKDALELLRIFDGIDPEAYLATI